MKSFARLTAAFLPILLTILFIAAPAAASQYDPAVEGVCSDYYRIDGDYITGIAPGTDSQKVAATCVPAGLTPSSPKAGTGTTFTYTLGDKTLSLTAITTGDLNGDAAITLADLLKSRSYLLGNELEDIAQAAGDLNGDGKMTIADYLMVKAYLLGREAAPTVPTAKNLFLMMPAASANWRYAGAAAYESGNTALFTVDETGKISTLQQEGAAFVYALDAEGNVLSRQLITVLNEPLTITLPETKCRLAMGQTKTLTPIFNHPVDPKLTWQSSDPSVVTVDNGVLKGVKLGTATVTVTTEQGQKATVDITVAPPIEHLAIERQLYKVKPGKTKPILVQMEPADTGEEILWTSSNPSVATVSADGTITGVSYGTVTVTAKGKYSGLTSTCQVKICDVKQVAITFDDGPSPYTEKLLNFLKENDIRVTFFLVGNRMSYYKDELVREVAEGHEIGYHSYAHDIQTGLSTERIISDFNKSDKLLYEMTGAHFTLWRTPGGGYNNRVVNAVPLPHIMWSVDTLDWQSLNANSVYRAIINNSRDGDIVLLHDLHRTSVEGAIMAMEQMLEGDYEFLTVTELLSRDGTPPEPSTTYFSGR